jgi:hypothetical protein
MAYEQVILKCADKEDSDSKPPIEDVGENPLNPQGNCWRYYDCTCTPLHECTETNSYRGISKRKRRRKKDSNNNNDPIVSDDEKSLLNQFRQKEKRNNESWDIGPIGGEL